MADLVAQKRQELLVNDDDSDEDEDGDQGKAKNSPSTTATKKFDMKRNIAFTIYGAVYQGMAQEFIYNHMYSIWFGISSTNIRTILSKVLFDLLVQVSKIRFQDVFWDVNVVTLFVFL